MLYGFLLFIFDVILYYLLPNSIALAAIVIISTAINTITDVKWRYVDDQFVIQPIIFALLYSVQTDSIEKFIILNVGILVFSVVLYLLGAWSSGDITGMLAASQIILLFEQPIDGIIKLITIFALVYFASILIYGAIKTRGKIFRRPSLLTTLESTFLVMAIHNFTQSYALLIMLMISFISSRFKKWLYHVASIMSIAYIIYTGADYDVIGKTFVIMYILSFIFSSTIGIKGTIFSRKVPGALLKEGDVIGEMIIEKHNQYFIQPVTLKNIVNVITNNAKFVVKPTAEGLSKEDVEFIKSTFSNNTFTVHSTAPIMPFIFFSLVLLFFLVL